MRKSLIVLLNVLIFLSLVSPVAASYNLEAGLGASSLQAPVDITPPPAPNLLIPTAGAAVNTPAVAFDWDDVDDPSGVTYRIEVDNNATFASPEYVATALAVSSNSSAALADGLYNWRVRATDGATNTGLWSTTRQFLVDTTPPAAPNPLLPAAGASVNIAPAAFDWNDVADPSGVSYRLEVDNNVDFATPEYVNALAVSSNSSATLADGIYNWRVRATDGATNIGAWSAIWQVTVVDTDPPPAPMLQTPPRGDQLDTHNVKFEWHPVYDVSGVTYHIVVTSIATGDTVQEKEGLRDTNIEFLLYDDYFGWNVTATDGAGNEGPTSTTWYFLVLEEDTGPPDVSVTSPNGVGASPPEATVTSPNGGEIIDGGSYFPITWYVSDANGGITSGHLMEIEIFFSEDGGKNFDVVALLDYNPGAFRWHVPNIDTDLGLIKIVTINDDLRTGVDVSDSAFTITSDASLPQGEHYSPHVSDSLKDDLVIVGETLIGGETFGITWYTLDDLTPTPDLKITIEFSHDNGENFEEIVQLDHNPGIFRWYVPRINTNEGFIRVDAEDEKGKVGRDVSDAAFTIVANPDLPFGLTPVDNVSGHVSLSWSSNGAFVTKFLVQRSTDNFASIDKSVKLPADARSFTDSSVKSGTRYSYRVISANGVLASEPSNVAEVLTAPGPVVPPAPAPVFSGGGGGGGGGGGFDSGLSPKSSSTEVEIRGLKGDDTLKLDSSSKTQTKVRLSDDSGKVSFDVAAGTKMMESSGKPLASISVDSPISVPPAPNQNTIVLTKEFGPNGATFDPPINLSMNFDPASLPAGASKGDLTIAFWDGGKWVNLPTTVDAANNKVSTLVSHFTPYAILAKTPAPAAQPALPTVMIISPTAGASLPAGNVTISVSPANITLVPPVPGNVVGQGHLHYYLDVAIPTTPGVPAVTAPGTYQAVPATSAVWAGLTPGMHTLGVQVVNNDHTPLVPPVTATVTISVAPPPVAAIVPVINLAAEQASAPAPAAAAPAPATTAPEPPVSPASAPQPAGSTSSNTGLIIGIIAVLAVVVLVTGVVYSRRRSSK